MTIRRALFLLFLYELLVLLLAFLLYKDAGPSRILSFFVLWSAIGIAALLVGLIVSGILAWRREHRAQAKPAPAAPEAPPAQAATQPSEETTSFAALVKEAQERLNRAISGPRRLQDLPLYLLVGPEGSGKTSVLHNAGIEAQLLAGQILGSGMPVAPTREANLWLANNSLFIELGGKAFFANPTSLAHMLGVLRPASQAKGWRRLFSSVASTAALRGVVLCFDARSFLSDDTRKLLSLGPMPPEVLEQEARDIRERLLAIADAFGASYPVYALFTHTDAIPFFTEFFDRLPDAEANQPFGVLALPGADSKSGQDRVWAEAETKRLIKDFNSVFLCLSTRRLISLSHEGVAARKPAIYEFPREFKRIRTPLVQFLVDALRPDNLRLSPVLRGFFFTGTRQAERGVERPLEKTQELVRGDRGSLDATRIFRPEATQTGDPSQKAKPPGELASGWTVKWVFANSFFQQILTRDRPASARRASVDADVKRYRWLAVAAAGAVFLFAFAVFTRSWWGNHELIRSVEEEVRRSDKSERSDPNASLRALDGLREALVDTLEKTAPWYSRLRWGLYVGDELRKNVRDEYFRRLREIILEPVNTQLVSRLAGVRATHQEQGVFAQLKTHLTITEPGCRVETPVVSSTLSQVFEEKNPNLDRELVDRQVSFFVQALARGNPAPVSRNQAAVDNARRYLDQSNDSEALLSQILREIHNSKHMLLSDVLPKYREVLEAPDEVLFEFTKEGEAEFTHRANGNKAVPRDTCVYPLGDQAKNVLAQVGNIGELRSLYYRRYKDYWKVFLSKCRVKPYQGLKDAAKKLDILSDSASPLLGLVGFVSENTAGFTASPAQAVNKSAVEQGLASRAASRFGISTTTPDAAVNKLDSADAHAGFQPEEIDRVFQPAHYTTPPGLHTLVSANNQQYIAGLRGLGQNIDKFASADTADKIQSLQAANDALVQANNAQKGLADNFHTNATTENVNGQLSDLLQQPIRNAKGLFPANAEKAAAGEKDAELAKVCQGIRPILSKYPFNPNASAEATLPELQGDFSPSGAIWNYQQKSLGELVAKDPSGQWTPKAGASAQVAGEMLAFLNRAQQVTNAFFGSGSQPSVQYTLRAVTPREVEIKLEIDGVTYNSRESVLQKAFKWPGGEQAQGASGFATPTPSFDSPFGKYSGLWGVFRLFLHAEGRPLNSKVVTWSEVFAPGGEVQRLAIPAKIEIVQFPGGVDLFNPRFFEPPLQCPKHALAQP